VTPTEARTLLGLNFSFSDFELRTAYHLKAKETHPDISSDESLAHLHMIEINQAYNLLRSTLGQTISSPQTNKPLKSDYELYRSGVSVYERIHPSEWVKVTKTGLFDPSVLEQKVESSVAFQMATKRIGEAYQIFSELINEFPNSIWAIDSRDKLKSLDKMLIRYKKMVKNCT